MWITEKSTISSCTDVYISHYPSPETGCVLEDPLYILRGIHLAFYTKHFMIDNCTLSASEKSGFFCVKYTYMTPRNAYYTKWHPYLTFLLQKCILSLFGSSYCNTFKNPTIFNIIRWVDGLMGRSSHWPSVWCSKYYFFHKCFV